MTASSEQFAVSSKRPGKTRWLEELLGCLLLSAFLLTVSLADAQQPKKIARIGLLSPFSPSATALWHQAFLKGLRDLGWVEGKNISIEYRYAEGKPESLADLAADLVRLKVDIIVVSVNTDTWAAKKTTRTIPIVMASAGDPVASGLVESLARPGGNVTGITILSRDLSAKRLELFKEAVPKISRVAVLYAPASAGAAREVKEVLPAAAQALGVTIRSWVIRAPEDFEKVFAELNKQRPDGLYLTPDVLLRFNQNGPSASR
jgi:putative ABC transport system substrate-binding protein